MVTRISFPIILYILIGILLLSCNKNKDDSLFSNDDSTKVIFNPQEEIYNISQRQWQGIPSIEKTEANTLWAAWYSGGETEGPNNYVLLCSSIDDGISWSEPLLVIDPGYPYRAFDPCLWVTPSNELWLFWAESNFNNNSKYGVHYIKCEHPEEINPKWTIPIRIADGVMINKPTIISNGTWLLPIAIWDNASYVYSSIDNGNTFIMRGYSKVPQKTYDEHMLVELMDHKLWELVRTSYGIGQTFSSDEGQSWSTGEASGLINANSRFFIRRLKSGNIIFIHNNPPNKDMSRSFLTASLSKDDGKSWPYHVVLDERSGVSYPDAKQDDEGYIYIIYDHNRSTDKEILFAKILEEDIINGKITDKSKLKQIVNKP